MLVRTLALLFLAGTTATLAAQSNVSFETYANAYSTDPYLIPLAAGDFNNDGKPDLIECCNSSNQLIFVAGNGDGTFQAPAVAYSTPITLVSVAAADVNGDGNLDLVGVGVNDPSQIPTDGNGQLLVFLGNGDGTFQAPQVYSLTEAGNPEEASNLQTVVGNFFGDGHPDVAVALDNGDIDLFRNEGNGTFVFDESVNVGGGSTPAIAAGDFNGNGVTDLAALTENTQLSVLWNDGKGNFTQQTLGTYNDATMTTSRLNGDGEMDILVSYGYGCAPPSGGSFCVGFDAYYGQGNNQLYKRTLVNDPSGDNPDGIGPIFGVDVNGDGYGDIVAVGATECTTSACTNSPSGLFVWLGNADGSFQQTPERFFTSENTYLGTAVMGDFNRDGMMDFAQTVSGGVTQFYINATARTACGTYTISPSVTVCQPVDQTYSPSPVTVQANSYDTVPVTAMQEYVDGSLEYSQPVTSFDTTFPVSDGAHLFVTKGWDASGRDFVADRTVTVYSGTPGPVCSAATDSASICLPSGTSSSSPVQIVANGNVGNSIPTAAQLYIDGSLVVDNKGADSYVQTTQDLTSGVHVLVFKVWDTAGNVVEAAKTVTVN